MILSYIYGITALDLAFLVVRTTVKLVLAHFMHYCKVCILILSFGSFSASDLCLNSEALAKGVSLIPAGGIGKQVKLTNRLRLVSPAWQCFPCCSKFSEVNI